MSLELKIKSKHLSVESQIIRFEERKLKKQLRWNITQTVATGANKPINVWDYECYKSYDSLNYHRRWDVRNENRATFLARAYLQGKFYSTVEQKRKPENEYRFQVYIVPRIVAMVNKYGPKNREVNSKMILAWANA
jgi:hypothetical protein